MARINTPTLPVVTTLLCALGMGAIISSGNAQSGAGTGADSDAGSGQSTTGQGTNGRDDTRTAPGTSGGRGAAGATGAPIKVGMDQANMRTIAEAGMCASMCTMTAAHCLDLGGEHASRTHQTLMADCADACGVTAALMSRNSPNAARMASTAAEIADQCARECDRLANNDAMMTRCAEMCRRTATTLRAQGKAGTGTNPSPGTPGSPPKTGTDNDGSGAGTGAGSGAGGSGTNTGRP